MPLEMMSQVCAQAPADVLLTVLSDIETGQAVLSSRSEQSFHNTMCHANRPQGVILTPVNISEWFACTVYLCPGACEMESEEEVVLPGQADSSAACSGRHASSATHHHDNDQGDAEHTSSIDCQGVLIISLCVSLYLHFLHLQLEIFNAAWCGQS
jgi:hypothetical protein